MRTILCVLLPPGAAGGPLPPAARWPAAALAAAQQAASVTRVDAVGALYCDLPDAAIWAAAVGAAQALLTHLQGVAGLARAGSRAGLARRAFPALCAAVLARPGTLHLLPPGAEPAGLAPLPLALLPGLSLSRRRLLHTLRVVTLGDLAALPAPVLARIGGPELRTFQALARGEDPHVVGARLPGAGVAPASGPDVSAWARLPAPPAPLTPTTAGAALRAAAAALATRLAAADQVATALTLAVGFGHDAPATQRVLLAPPTAARDALLAAAAPALARLRGAHRRRPAWVQLAAARWRGAVIQPPLTGWPAPA